ncbi:STN domain-containing protein [Anaeromyxobacter diazotrophicus]|uniref:Secretin/TonB short N-terminal domain-containing protein n=1 Tax=Anaeromyxobacter diazotrophicus TaxID=2590199 RepID=A0A7I9VM18_9BACT|nr:STN domain-containing protein [Anaeromyxobacter diazotrophicus]GEJ57441.1 hypothetical protein AMYX_21820 [Anaeromyxobacter diazotrophicus]
MLLPTLLALLLAAPPPPRPPAPPPAPREAPAQAGARRLGAWPAHPSGKTVTLEDESVTLDDALAKIAEAAGWSLVAHTGSLGERELRLTLRRVPVEEALDAVLEGTPLAATRRGEVVTVAPGRAGPADVPVLSGFEKPTGKRFTGDFAEAPVGEALTKVADAGGLSLVLPPGLRGAVNGHFREAPVEDALRALLAQAGLTARREGGILTVARQSGPSLVIQGGKRGFTFHYDTDEADPGADAQRSLRDAQRAERDARREAKRAQREARRAAGKGGNAQVTRGDKVVGAGERAGQVVVLTGNVRLDEGASAEQVVAVLGSVELAPGASVDGEVVAVGGDIHVSPGARIAGEAVSVGGRIVIDPSGAVEGEQVSLDVPGLGGALALLGARTPGFGPRTPLLGLAHALVQFAVFFGLGLLLLVVFPRRVEALTGSVSQAPLKAVLTGILGTLALPVVALLLVATIVGIPLVAVLVLGVLVAAVMGYTALALHLGRLVPFHFERGAPILQLAIGTAVLVAIGQLPVLGALAWLAAWLLVFGIVLRTRFGRPPTAAPPPVYGTTAPPPPSPPPAPPPATGTEGR